MYGTLNNSTGGPKSFNSMYLEGVSSLNMALLMRRIRVEPCSGSSTTLFSKPMMSELTLQEKNQVNYTSLSLSLSFDHLLSVVFRSSSEHIELPKQSETSRTSLTSQ